MENLYHRRLKCFQNDLLSNNGPIGTFSARIKIASALAWINSDVEHDLDVVRKVRNDFAHSFDHDLSFDTQSIADKCRNLRTAQALIEGHEIAASIPHKSLTAAGIRAMSSVFQPPRSRYEITVEFISQHLDKIASDDNDYTAVDFMEEVRQFGANVDVRISGKITIRPLT
jgi:hypothetical protein